LLGGGANDWLFGNGGSDYFDLSLDINAGDFDYIGDLQALDAIVLPNGYQPCVTYVQNGADVIGTVALGASSYSFWVDGFGGAGLSITQVQTQTLFV
jgi:hypothetical protein